MKKSKRETVNLHGATLKAGTELPPEVAAMVSLTIFLRREGDDPTGQYDDMTASVMLQADGDEHLMGRLSDGQSQLQPAISAFVKALTAVLGGEVIGRSSMPTIDGRRIGRA